MKSIREQLDKLQFSSKKLTEYLLVVGSATTIYLFVGLRGILYEPFRMQLGSTNAQLGILMSVSGFIQIFGYLLFGWIQERMNVRKLLTFDMLGYGLTGMFIAFSKGLPFSITIICFVLFGIFGDAMYWPTIQKSVKYIGGKTAQARAFGTMESLRAVGGFIINSLDVILYSTLTGISGMIWGIKGAMMFNSGITLLFALLIWFKMPKDFMQEKINSATKTINKTKIGLQGVVKALKLPVVWLTGLSSACAYIAYVGVSTYFVPYLQNTFFMSASLVAIFGIVNGTAVNALSAFLSGLISDKLFKNSAVWMSICYALMSAFIFITLIIPKRKSMVIIAMIFLLLTTLSCFLIRAVYYSPLGEYGIPTDISSTAMSIASFVGYSPSFFAYPIFGSIIDNNSSIKAYTIIFMVLIVFSIFGIIINIINSRLISKNK
ncbi:MFS transporter [Bombilactobacillus bombi]|uniref:MFS transporter n=1 Tax=Bombilactobacillus bombi TaxID=1303590 RepID=UPI0015E617E3|nr:MFS transporter [Bombilactobacillus bombi]MBA1435224.1 MFS transporter [Bombilactobacillus bombi]